MVILCVTGELSQAVVISQASTNIFLPILLFLHLFEELCFYSIVEEIFMMSFDITKPVAPYASTLSAGGFFPSFALILGGNRKRLPK